jgi:uncharacterized protein YcbK (DUF882 family)
VRSPSLLTAIAMGLLLVAGTAVVGTSVAAPGAASSTPSSKPSSQSSAAPPKPTSSSKQASAAPKPSAAPAKPASAKPTSSKPPASKTTAKSWPKKAIAKAPSAAPAKDPYAAKPDHPGVLKLKRNGKITTVTLLANDKVSKEGLATLADVFARSKDESHAIDAALATLLVNVSDHFGGRTIEIVAGYWAPKPGTKAHAEHTSGRAVDFRIEGVPTEHVRNYCSTLSHAGVGYYTDENLVHLDTRKHTSSWSHRRKPAAADKTLAPTKP